MLFLPLGVSCNVLRPSGHTFSHVVLPLPPLVCRFTLFIKKEVRHKDNRAGVRFNHQPLGLSSQLNCQSSLYFLHSTLIPLLDFKG